MSKNVVESVAGGSAAELENSSSGFIPANVNLPEITLRALILSVFLVIILSAANAYLGLKIGATISASIPAAIVSMGVLRFFKNSNILENNIVQTAASAGEAISVGIGYLIPAMIIIHYWNGFNYTETMCCSLIGGILGVLFSIPVRRILLFHPDLKFPEGTAIGQVLIAGADQSGDLKHLLMGGLFGGLISFLQSGLQVVSASAEYWTRATDGIIYGFGLGYDPALLAAGYIVGPTVAASTLVGVIIGWLAGVPILSHFYGTAPGNAADAAMGLWHDHIRYIGVGAMLVGGLWTLIILFKPLAAGVKASFQSMQRQIGETQIIPRTERDIPMQYVIWGVLLLCIPLTILYTHYVNEPHWQLAPALKYVLVALCVVFTILSGFVFSVVGAYFAGLIGSTNSPTSALTLLELILMALLILVIAGPFVHFSAHPATTIAGIALTMIVAAVLSATSISNETIQDLKAGYMVGATPWKQQVMLIVGVVIAALICPLVFQLLFDAYGIGGIFPRPGMDPANMLAAPQAGMIAALVQSTFSLNLPLGMLLTGAVIGVCCIVIDYFLQKRNLSLPILAVGIGIYLPLDSAMPFVCGGFATFIVMFLLKRKKLAEKEQTKQEHRGITLACGIVAGAALMGVLLAIPFAIAKSTDLLKIGEIATSPIADILALLFTFGIFYWIYHVVCKRN